MQGLSCVVHEQKAQYKISNSHSYTHTYNGDVVLPSRDNTSIKEKRPEQYRMRTFPYMPTHIHVYRESPLPCLLPKYSHLIEHPSISPG
jgi:hypothetical protein